MSHRAYSRPSVKHRHRGVDGCGSAWKFLLAFNEPFRSRTLMHVDSESTTIHFPARGTTVSQISSNVPRFVRATARRSMLTTKSVGEILIDEFTRPRSLTLASCTPGVAD